MTSGDVGSRLTFKVRWALSQLVLDAFLTKLSKRKRVTSIEGTERRLPQVGKHQTRDIHCLRSLSNVQRRSVSTDALGESNRAVPASGIGKHDLRTSSSFGKLQELGRPRRH